MKTKLTSLLALCCLPGSLLANNPQDFSWQRGIEGINAQWHSIELPADIFAKIRGDYGDVRIISTKGDKQGQPAPYVLKSSSPQQQKHHIAFSLLNQSSAKGVYYYTFETAGKPPLPLSEIALEFGRKDFDWKVNLQGSHDQLEWFDLLKDYRILSLHNNAARLEFCRLLMAPANYRYYRLAIPEQSDPQLRRAALSLNTSTQGSYFTRNIKHLQRREDGKNRCSIIEVELDALQPLSQISYKVTGGNDYWRYCQLEYLDSIIMSEKGALELYKPLLQARMQSGEAELIDFATVNTSKLRWRIYNQDNAPLDIQELQVKGPKVQLLARFEPGNDYSLFYGNSKLAPPDYDIAAFEHNIPKQPSPATLAQEQRVAAASPAASPDGTAKYWLWALMAGVIAVLLLLSRKMLASGNGSSAA